MESDDMSTALPNGWVLKEVFTISPFKMFT